MVVGYLYLYNIVYLMNVILIEYKITKYLIYINTKNNIWIIYYYYYY